MLSQFRISNYHYNQDLVAKYYRVPLFLGGGHFVPPPGTLWQLFSPELLGLRTSEAENCYFFKNAQPGLEKCGSYKKKRVY